MYKIKYLFLAFLFLFCKGKAKKESTIKDLNFNKANQSKKINNSLKPEEILVNNIFKELKHNKDAKTKQYLYKLFNNKATPQEKIFLSQNILGEIVDLKDKEKKYDILETLLKKGLDPNAYFTNVGNTLLSSCISDIRFVEILLKYQFNLNALVYGNLTWGGPKHMITSLIDALDFLNFKYNFKKFDYNTDKYIKYVKNLFSKFFDNGLNINVIYQQNNSILDLFKLNIEHNKTYGEKYKNELNEILKELINFLKIKGAKTIKELKEENNNFDIDKIMEKLNKITEKMTKGEQFNNKMIKYNEIPGLDAWHISLYDTDDPMKMIPDPDKKT